MHQMSEVGDTKKDVKYNIKTTKKKLRKILVKKLKVWKISAAMKS